MKQQASFWLNMIYYFISSCTTKCESINNSLLTVYHSLREQDLSFFVVGRDGSIILLLWLNDSYMHEAVMQVTGKQGIPER